MAAITAITIHIETKDANKKLDELLEKANQLKATLKECGITADLEKTGGTEERLGTIAICKYRTALNMTQLQLALMVGVGPNAIAQYESGARNVPVMTKEDYEREAQRLAELEAKGVQVKF